MDAEFKPIRLLKTTFQKMLGAPTRQTPAETKGLPPLTSLDQLDEIRAGTRQQPFSDEAKEEILRQLGLRPSRLAYDVAPWALYDRATVAAGAAFPRSLSMFQVPYGRHDNSGKVRTFSDTNMWSSASNGFSAPTAFLLRRIHVNAFVDASVMSEYTGTLSDYSALRSYSWEFRILQKSYACGTFATDARCESLPRMLSLVERLQASRETLDFEEGGFGGYYLGSMLPWAINAELGGDFYQTAAHFLCEISFLLEGLMIRAVQ